MNRAQTPPPKRQSEAGTMLLITMNVVVVLSAMAAAFLVVAHSDNTEHQSNNQRVRALYIAEAGVNFALVDLHKGESGNQGSEQSPISFGQGSYWVDCTMQDQHYRIVSQGRFGAEIVSVEVVAQVEAGEGAYAMGAGSLELTKVLGTSSIDSYDSSMGSYESQASGRSDSDGDPASREGGTVMSNGDIEIGPTATVFGDVMAPSVNVPLAASVTGITASMGQAQSFVPVVVPALGPLPPRMISGQQDDSIGSGNHKVNGIQIWGNSTVSIIGPATIVVGWIEVSENATILIDATNGPVYIYPTESILIKDNGSVGAISTQPKDLVIQSDINNTTGFEGSLTGDPSKPISVENQGQLSGVLYAPDATVVVKDFAEMFGSVLARRIVVTGDGALHFDEALKSISGIPAGGSQVASDWVGGGASGYPGNVGGVVSWRLINADGELSLSEAVPVESQQWDPGILPLTDPLLIPEPINLQLPKGRGQSNK